MHHLCLYNPKQLRLYERLFLSCRLSHCYVLGKQRRDAGVASRKDQHGSDAWKEMRVPNMQSNKQLMPADVCYGVHPCKATYHNLLHHHASLHLTDNLWSHLPSASIFDRSYLFEFSGDSHDVHPHYTKLKCTTSHKPEHMKAPLNVDFLYEILYVSITQSHQGQSLFMPFPFTSMVLNFMTLRSNEIM